MHLFTFLVIAVACLGLSSCELHDADVSSRPAPTSHVSSAPTASGTMALDETADSTSTTAAQRLTDEIGPSVADILVAADMEEDGGDQSHAAPQPAEAEVREPTSEASASLDDAAASEPRYTYSDDHDPNGIGKFYMGREIAMVMGHQGIAWLERPERDAEEGLSLLIECLDIEPGSTVADIGAGSGVLTTRFCEAVGEEGTVVAVDIQQEMLDALQLKVHEQGHRNVELVLGTVESPRLEPGTLDLVVMVDVYHEFEYPYEMLLNISQAMRPGGRVVFVEYRKEDPEVLIKLVHKMTEAQVILEASLPEFQLEHVETIDDLPVQHVIVFRRSESATVEPNEME